MTSVEVFFPPDSNVDKPTYAQIEGIVVYVKTNKKGDNHNVFSVYTKNSEKEYNCVYDGFCPLQDGDLLEGICKIESDTDLVFERPPIIRTGQDKNSLIKYIIKSQRCGGINLATKIYEHLLYRIDRHDKIVPTLTKLAELWQSTKNPEIVERFSDGIKETQMRKLLDWWYKNQNLRRTYILGLTKEDLRKIALPPDIIFEQCLKNPYAIAPLPLIKCNDILLRRCMSPSIEDQQCAIIVRKIYEYMENKGWSCVPVQILITIFPNYQDLSEKLKNEYGVVEDMSTVYLPEVYKIESTISNKIDHLLDTPKKHDFKSNIKYIHESLTDDQINAINGALSNSISIITGSAGTGKTTIIREIIHNLEINSLSYMIVSFTGKAVSRIREVLKNKSASTMHRLIHNPKNRKTKFDYLIIDEAAMVTSELFHQFLEKFTDDYNIILIGDPNQLEPIGRGFLFEQLIKSQRIPIYKLTHVHRTSSDFVNGIYTNAERMINVSDSPLFKFDITDNFQIYEGSIELVRHIISQFHDKGIGYDRFVIITPYNRDLEQLNRYCQDIYNKGKRFTIDKNGNCWMIGDRVSLSTNRYDINIMNGEEGVIVGVNDGISVKFKDGSVITFGMEIIEDKKIDVENEGKLTVKLLRHSFALTVHLSQGSEWDNVILYVPKCMGNSRFLTKRMIYTAITRAKKSITCVGDIMSIQLAATRDPIYRCDNLAKRVGINMIQISINDNKESETQTQIMSI